ncbi:MAG TPA: type II toxin-antitoxin system HipA family toxin [Myxococcota bacterium]|nr:type II toxin-antitoxin system HipA family toxin [Myxococcota bacterium]
MPRKRTRSPLNVYLNSRLVGRLRRQASGATDFQYDPDWLAWEHAIPVSLSLPLREDRYTGERVLAVIDNLLPDNEPIRRRIAERLEADGYDAYSLLAKTGRDCAGALQFLPEGEEPGPPGVVKASLIDNATIGQRLGHLATSPLGIEADEDFRISIAGAQEKTALLFWKGKWHVPHGTTPTTHILKPQIGKLRNGIDLSRSVENEFLCMRLAAAFGLPTAQVEIADFEGTRALVVERFDRQWTGEGRLLRRPQEDCCQALSVPPTRKYEADGGPGIPQVLDLLKGSDDPETDRRTFLKAQILFWLLGATDGHAKNLSVFLRPGGRFVLAPLYDIMSAQPALDAKQLSRNKMKLAMVVGRNRHDVIDRILPRHFIQTAEKGGVGGGEVETILAEIVAAQEEAIALVCNALPKGFPEDLTESIVDGLRKRLKIVSSVALPRGDS